MKKNVGVIDKWIRIILAVIGIVLYLTKVATGTLGIVVLVIALLLVLTSILSFCPLYPLLGIKTTPKEK
jgi:hypothetical protein